MSGKTLGQIAYEGFVAFQEPGEFEYETWADKDEHGDSATMGRADWEAAAQAVAAHAANPTAEDDSAAEIMRLRGVLERLADPDVWVLDSGLGGGTTEELHVRASLAAQALGREVLCCTECCVSLGIEPEDWP